MILPTVIAAVLLALTGAAVAAIIRLVPAGEPRPRRAWHLPAWRVPRPVAMFLYWAAARLRRYTYHGRHALGVSR